MKITYIFHSGFAVETENSVLIFDYFMDPAGVIPGILNTDKPLYIFASHFHEDHFTKKILKWREDHPSGKLTYILSKDILKRKRADKDAADIWMAKGASWRVDNITVKEFTDERDIPFWSIEHDGETYFI